MGAEAKEDLRVIFAQSLGIDRSRITDDLAYSSIPEWDSIAHMVLVAAIESKFEIMLDTADILDMSSVQATEKILERYGVNFG